MRKSSAVCALWLVIGFVGPSVAAETMNPMLKVSPSLRTAWHGEPPWHARRRWAECFVKVEGSYDESMAVAFRRVDFKVRSVIPQGSGLRMTNDERQTTILTGSIRLDHLYDLADLPFVVSVEGAVPMGKKKPMGLK